MFVGYFRESIWKPPTMTLINSVHVNFCGPSMAPCSTNLWSNRSTVGYRVMTYPDMTNADGSILWFLLEMNRYSGQFIITWDLLSSKPSVYHIGTPIFHGKTSVVSVSKVSMCVWFSVSIGCPIFTDDLGISLKWMVGIFIEHPNLTNMDDNYRGSLMTIETSISFGCFACSVRTRKHRTSNLGTPRWIRPPGTQRLAQHGDVNIRV